LFATGAGGGRKRGGRRENGGKSAMVVGGVDAPVHRSFIHHDLGLKGGWSIIRRSDGPLGRGVHSGSFRV